MSVHKCQDYDTRYTATEKREHKKTAAFYAKHGLNYAPGWGPFKDLCKHGNVCCTDCNGTVGL